MLEPFPKPKKTHKEKIYMNIVKVSNYPGKCWSDFTRIYLLVSFLGYNIILIEIMYIKKKDKKEIFNANKNRSPDFTF